MKFTRLQLAMVLTSVGTLCAGLAVVAQEGRPLWAPPTVLPAEETPRPTPTNPTKKPPLRLPQPEKKAKADPTLAIPPEVYELPYPLTRPQRVPVTITDVVQIGGVDKPPPLPLPPQLEEKNDLVPLTPAPLPPPLPMFEPKAIGVPALELKPPPLPEPTKALITELMQKDMPKSGGAKGIVVEMPIPPALPIEPKKESTTIPPPTLEPRPIAPPALPIAPKKESTTIPPPTFEPKTMTPPVMPKEPKADFALPLPSVETRKVAPVKSFVPVRLNPPTGPLPSQPSPLNHETQRVPFAPSALGGGMIAPILPSAPVVGMREGQIITPMIVVEKRGPSHLREGETQTYQIVIRNISSITARQVRIEDEIAPEVRAVAAEPLPQVQGTKAVWTLPMLAPGAEQSLRISLQAISPVNLPLGTSVHVTATNAGGVSTVVMRPRNPVETIAVQLIAPTGLSVGKPAVFDIRVTNLSNQPLVGLTLRGSLGEGFNTPEGNDIKGEINVAMQPGEARTLKMPATAVKSGRHTVAVKVAPNGGTEVGATTSVDVVGTTEPLRIQTPALTKLLLGRDGDLRMEITNQSGQTARNVDVASKLPEGLEFVGASDRGLYQANSRTVFWHINELPAERTITLTLRVQGGRAGQYAQAIFVRADGVPEIKGSTVISVAGVADLTLRVIHRDNTLELGRDTSYEIQVVNPGTSAARDVQVRVEFPQGMQPKQTQGNTNHDIVGQTVTFATIPHLAPQGQMVLHVSATAQTPGDQRVRFAVVSDQVRTPVQREISTLVYRD